MQIRKIFILLLLLSQNKCTSMFLGTNSHNISFTSNIEKVKVYIDGDFIGETPIQKEINTNRRLKEVIFKKDGYITRRLFMIRDNGIFIPSESSIGRKLMCGIDIFPGSIITLFMSPIINNSTGSCSSYNPSYFREMYPITEIDKHPEIENEMIEKPAILTPSIDITTGTKKTYRRLRK